MPSVPHELLVHIAREHPDVVLDLAPDLAAAILGDAEEISRDTTTLSELQPAEYGADAVLIGRIAAGEHAIGALIVEVQLATDEDKLFSWPLYIAGLRGRLRCPVALLVITLDDSLLGACDHLDEGRARFDADLVFAVLGDATRRELEAMMDIEHYEFQSEFMKRLTARATEVGIARGREEGRERVARKAVRAPCSRCSRRGGSSCRPTCAT